ncbi:5-fold beta-flower protein [Fibrella arboris]|uniref:5-fold beta-flower protein n=1 Tax=Fibrella arboris TaxID=3242486 RepID=UPI0035230C1A
MKNKQTLRLLLALFVALPSLLFAQSANYKQPMSINATGQIKDGSGKGVGTVSKDRMIMDANGKNIAFVDGQGNLVDAKTGKKMGRMGKDGKTYMDANGDLMFTIKDKADNTCDIFDAKGKKIGNVHDSYKGTACALHCFQAGHTHMK